MFDTTKTAHPDPNSSPQPPRRRVSRALLTLALAGGLTAGGLSIANAANNTATTPPNASSSSTAGVPNAATPGHGPNTRAGGKHADKQRPGQQGAGTQVPGNRGPGAGNPATDSDGMISTVNGSTLTVRTDTGMTRSYTLASTTSVHQGPGRTMPASALRAGERVHVRGQAAASSGTITAVDVDVHPAHIDGTVASVAGSIVSVTDRDGFTRRINAAGATGASTVRTGSTIHAEGRVDGDGTTLDATSIGAPTAPHPRGHATPGAKGAHGPKSARGAKGAPGAKGARPARPAGASNAAPKAKDGHPAPPALGTGTPGGGQATRPASPAPGSSATTPGQTTPPTVNPSSDPTSPADGS